MTGTDECALQNIIRRDLNKVRTFARGNEPELSTITSGWQSKATDSSNRKILIGICHIVALRDLGEYNTEAEDSSYILEQNVRDACGWVYGSTDVDIDQCKSSIRHYCLRTLSRSNKIIVQFQNETC